MQSARHIAKRAGAIFTVVAFAVAGQAMTADAAVNTVSVQLDKPTPTDTAVNYT